MERLTMVTGSTKKAEDAGNILGFPIEVVNLELEEIQSLDLEEIAGKKAALAYESIKRPLIVDDVGLYIAAWNGFPGPFIKFVFSSGGSELLVKMMEGEKNRSAVAVGVIAYHDGKAVHTFRGESHGSIASQTRGEGFGFEPIFIPEGYDKTWAELGDEIKNSHSQRRRSLDKFNEYLSNTVKSV